MTSQELKLKVINAQAKVEKRAEIIRKHRDRLAKMIAKGADEYDIEYKKDEIEEATKKLQDAKKVLANWQAKLDEKISQDEYLEANCPEVLKTFLEGWAQRTIEYYRDKMARFIEFRNDLRQKEREARIEALNTLPELQWAREAYKDRKPTDYDLNNLWPRDAVEDFLKARGLAYRQIQKKLNDFGDQITFQMLTIRDAAEREAWLKKTIEEEKRAKLLDLVGRIIGTVGTITDASALYIGPEGDINGCITGTEGKAKIQTIGAGGYAVQCFHFRTLIHEIK